MRKGELFAELVPDDERETEAEEEVGEGEVEDEDVPRRPHGLAPHHSGNYQEIVQNWYLENVSQIRHISITKLIAERSFYFAFPLGKISTTKKFDIDIYLLI